MEERNKIIFQINNKNSLYSLTTSLIGNKLYLVCQDSNSHIYENNFSIQELLKISKYFQPTHTIEQIQIYLNRIIENQRIGINQSEEALNINLYLINNDFILIPLLKKVVNKRFNNYQFKGNNNQANQYISNNQASAPHFHNQNSNNLQMNINQQFSNKNQIINKNEQASSLNSKICPQVDSQRYYNNSYNNYIDENKLINLENNNNIIKEGQEKLKSDIKRLIEEISKLKKENEIYKNEHESLIKENTILKKQIIEYENNNKIIIEENNAFKKQFETYNKDLDAVESQNDEIRKMYEELENEYKQYKKQTEESNKENEILRSQIEELNNNYILINKELENITNENNIFKKNLEEQKNNLNEDMVNKLIEENNILKKKGEENEFLKKKIEVLQYQIQIIEKEKEKERGILNDNNNDDNEVEEEDKGEIIHNMKELELITDKINKENKKIILNLLYKASVDGDKASIFHEKCDQAKSTIVLVETNDEKRFGGYTTCSWAGNCEDKSDSNAFIFSLDKMKTYDNIPGDEAIGCYPKFGPIFLGCQIKIFDNFFTKGGTTFEKELNFNTKVDYELTGGERVFQVKEIEVYEVIIK